MRKSFYSLLAALTVMALLLSACGKAAEATVVATEAPAVTEAPAPTDTTAPEPTATEAAEVTEAPTEAPTQEVTEAPSGPPDLSGETITLYHFGDLSGPYAAITSPLIHGAEDAVKAINDAG